MPREITPREILQRIRKRIKAGSSIRYEDLVRDDPALARAVRSLFAAELKKAVREARMLRLRRDAKERRAKKLRDQVIRRVKLRHSQGKSLSLKDVRRDDYSLLCAGCRHIGSWQKALEASGFSYVGIRKRLPTPKPYWNQELVIERIRERAARGLALNLGAVRKSDEALYLAGMRHFKRSWRAVIEASGFSYERVVKVHVPEYWTADLVIESIQARVRAGLSISHGDLRREDDALANAARRYFLTLEAAIETSGYPYDAVIKVWRARRRIKHLRPFRRDSPTEH